MTTDSTAAGAMELPVSLELQQVLEAFSKHTTAIFEDLSAAAPRQGSAGVTSASNATSRSLDALFELDERLAGLLHKARTHEANQRQIEQLKQRMLDHELQWREEMLVLEQDRKSLEGLLSQGRKAREQIDKAAKAQLKPSTILAYARMLAPYTSAPPRHPMPGAEQPDYSNPAAIPGAILPYPTEEVMRRGRLAFDEVGAIGEVTEMTGAKPPSPHDSISQSQPIPAPTAARRPRAALPAPEEEEDFSFDLDLNPDL